MSETARDKSRWLGLACVACVVALLVLPAAFGGGGVEVPDAIEHMAIANAWLQGSGFVDPIQYSYQLPGSPPQPASALRAPVVPALLVLPLAAGAGVSGVALAHAFWSLIVCLACHRLATRFMSSAAAAAAIVLLASTTAWQVVALTPLTEVTSLLALVAVIASARGILHSLPATLLCSLLSLLAWLTRPNLGLLVVAVAGGVVWHLGLRRAARHLPLYAYLLGFAALFCAARLTLELLTGLPPYAGYGVASESLSSTDWQRYERLYVGAWSFVISHQAEVLASLAERPRQLFVAIGASRLYGHLGWLLPVGIVHALVVRRRIPLELAICCLATLGFAAVVLGNYAYFDALRFPLQLMASGLLACFIAFDSWPAVMAPQRAALARGGGVLLVALAALFIALMRPTTSGTAARGTASEQARGELARVCGELDPDELVATRNPWALHAMCGNPAIRTPIDVRRAGVLERFVEERRPGVFVTEGRRSLESERLDLRARHGRYAVFGVAGTAAESPRWRAPVALACAGGEWSCAVREGRLRVSPPP